MALVKPDTLGSANACRGKTVKQRRKRRQASGNLFKGTAGYPPGGRNPVNPTKHERKGLDSNENISRLKLSKKKKMQAHRREKV